MSRKSTNEYGAKLDKNGYAPSVMGEMDRCALCGRRDRALQRHECFHGAYREKSKNYGCWILICDLCHEKIHHKGGGMDQLAKTMMQNKAMEFYGWGVDEFRDRFGKNYV